MKLVRIVNLSAILLIGAGGAAFAAAAAPAPQSPPIATHSSPIAVRHEVRALLNNENRETAALNLLGANGYSDFVNFRADGKNFEATVLRGGKTETVVVNPDARTVTRRM
ncbi:MAG TPA: hypothetical protein VLX09_26320 [Stellaceae bacterium]|nr:hypothetical protein [Stellaceae bacterium]